MIDKSVRLECAPDAAFRLFTERVSEWWPKTHRLTRDPESTLFLEPAGRFWERATDGREGELGRVTEWDPPHRLVLDFYMGTNPAQPTLVEVRFAPEGSGTRVSVHHRAKPESEALWTGRASVFERSWSSVLSALAEW